jgi:hypothetical protein
MSGTHQHIERYLDNLFDHLGGQGAAGRRMLDEAADHLRSSAAEMAAAGVPQAEAERRAVAAFGASGHIAGLLRNVHRGSRLTAAASTAAAIAGQAVLMLAGAHLAAAVALSVWGTSVPIMRQTATTGTVQVLIAILVLCGRLGAVQAGWLPSATSAHTTLGAAVAALLGVAVLVDLPLAAAQLWNMTGLWRLAAALITLFALINLLLVAVAHRMARREPATQATAHA